MREAFTLCLTGVAVAIGGAFLVLAQELIPAVPAWHSGLLIALGLLLITEAVALWVIVTDKSPK